MTRAFLFLLTVLLPLLTARPASAEEDLIPFREDSGLTKTEYFLTARQFSAALDAANDVLKRHPRNADAYTYRGYAYARLGDIRAAAQNFRKAIELDPAHLGANKYLADLYLETGNIPRALEQLQVIRMVCGHTDCEELNELERAIDKHKRGEAGKQEPSPENKTEENK